MTDKLARMLEEVEDLTEVEDLETPEYFREHYVETGCSCGHWDCEYN